MLTMLKRDRYISCTFKLISLLRFFDRRFHTQQYEAQGNADKNEAAHDRHDGENLGRNIACTGCRATPSSAGNHTASKALSSHCGSKSLLSTTLRNTKADHVLALCPQTPKRLQSPHLPHLIAPSTLATAAAPRCCCCYRGCYRRSQRRKWAHRNARHFPFRFVAAIAIAGVQRWRWRSKNDAMQQSKTLLWAQQEHEHKKNRTCLCGPAKPRMRIRLKIILPF